MQPAKRIPFQVDIAGVIEIMGASLYSRPETAVRELIQNAHDAVVRRRKQDLGYSGRIDLLQDAPAGTLTIEDDGIGLTYEEAEKYLGTLGLGITGLLKGRGREPSQEASDLIGQFGIGLFSAFMLADRLVVESRRADATDGVRWEAGAGTEIEISGCSRDAAGAAVTLHLKEAYRDLARDDALLENIVKQYADYLPAPIFINRGAARTNLIDVAWLQATPDPETLELEIESYFGETPLDVIPMRMEKPAKIAGVLYVTQQRTPGFTGEPVVTATVRRMVISQRVSELIPDWAPFLRGALELSDCRPTASREDLVRDAAFEKAREALERRLYEHCEAVALEDRSRWDAVVSWHRYSIAGAALGARRLRNLLARTYRWNTSQGQLTFAEILERSAADPILETEADYVLWYNADRRQERWVNELFAGQDAPCVHALMSFEESLLGAMSADSQERAQVDLRTASPGTPSFASQVLGIEDLEPADAAWEQFLGDGAIRVQTAEFASEQPVIAFLNERYELAKTFDALKRDGEIPSGFQRMIDTHFAEHQDHRNEVVLNRRHRLVRRALSQGSGSPTANAH